jgi:hypothetical protein
LGSNFNPQVSEVRDSASEVRDSGKRGRRLQDTLSIPAVRIIARLEFEKICRFSFRH